MEWGKVLEVLGYQESDVVHHHGGRYVGIVDAVASHTGCHDEFAQLQRNGLRFIEEGGESQELVDIRHRVRNWKPQTV